MEHRNPSKSTGHGKHLHDAHRQDDKYSSRTNETTSDTLVHRYTPVGVKREPVGGLHLHSSTTSDTLVHMYTPVGVKREPVGGLHLHSSTTSDTLVRMYAPVGAKREPALHCHSSTEDNATSFSNKIKPSVDPASHRTKTVVMAANTEATKSRHRNFPNVGQTDSTSDDVSHRPTTKQLSAMSREVHPKRSTLSTTIPFVACMTKAESKRLQWERGRSEEAKCEEYEPRMHPAADPRREKGNMFIDTGNMFSESVAQFDDTHLVSAQAPVPDAAAGTLAPPGQTEVETVRLFSAPLGTRDGGPGPLDSTLRRQNMVDHVTHHEME